MRGRAVNYELVDIDSWPRKAQYDYFKDYAQPYCNVCTEVDVTALVDYCHKNSLSFTRTSIYTLLRAANLIPAFRYRFHNGDVVDYQQIDGRLLLLHEDESLGFCHLPYFADFRTFHEKAGEIIAQAKAEKNTFKPQEKRRKDVLHFSVSPWMYLTSVTHPRNDNKGDIPKVVLARYVKREDRILMPVSVEIHHALMDGFHICKLVTKVQECLDNPHKELAW